MTIKIGNIGTHLHRIRESYVASQAYSINRFVACMGFYNINCWNFDNVYCEYRILYFETISWHLVLKISYTNHHQFTSIGVRIRSSFIILPKALGGPSANPSYGVIKSSNHPGLALRLPCLSFSVENFLRNSVPSIKYQFMSYSISFFDNTDFYTT